MKKIMILIAIFLFSLNTYSLSQEVSNDPDNYEIETPKIADVYIELDINDAEKLSIIKKYFTDLKIEI